jgi:starvation-inducible DNA-binding protein
MDELKKAMKIAFSSEFAFYLKAHNFHWNVEGIHFAQFHELFGNIYTEVYGSIDPFAENIRKLDSYTPGSFTRFSMLSMVDDETGVLSAEDMVAELLTDSDKMTKILKRVFDMATDAGEDGLANFLAERMDAHQKHSWMLRSSLK